MAYTATVTKESVSQVGSDSSLYNITIRMTVSDGQEDVFSEIASAKHNTNSPDLSRVKANLIEQLSAKWDRYASENSLYTATTFDTMVGQIQTAANNYVGQ